MRKSTLALLLATLIAAGCAEASTSTDAPVWLAVEVNHSGEIEGEIVFGPIQDIALDRSGAVFVREHDLIRLFSPSGELVRQVSRTGGGPGEFQSAIGMALGSDDTLRVIDAGAGRVHLFDLTGHYARSIPFKLESYGPSWHGSIGDDGAIIDPLPSGNLVRIMGKSGETIDTLPFAACIPKTNYRQRTLILNRIGNAYTAGAIRYQARPQTAFGPSGTVWCTPSDEYLAVSSSLGSLDTLGMIRRHVANPPVPREHREALLKICRANGAPDGSACDEASIPEVKPVIEQISIDYDNRLWVRRVDENVAGPSFDLYNESGKAIARICFAAPVRAIPTARGEMVTGIIRDTLTDVESLAWFRIVKEQQSAPGAHCLTGG